MTYTVFSENSDTAKIRVLSSGTLSQTIDVENFATAVSRNVSSTQFDKGGRNEATVVGRKLTVLKTVELKKQLETTHEFAEQHAKAAQEQYAKYYNVRAREKAFSVDEEVIIIKERSWLENICQVANR